MKTKRPYQNKFNRSDDTPLTLTDRDMMVFSLLNRNRFLNTDQIYVGLGETSTKQTVQRRLKRLFNHGYLARLRPFMRQGDPNPCLIYHLTKQSGEVLESNGELIKHMPKGNNVGQQFLQHTLEVADIRIALERACLHHPQVFLESAVGDREFRKNIADKKGFERYELYEAFHDEYRRKLQFIYPDLRVILASRVNPKIRMLLFFEIDRGTERLEVIHNKFAAYSAYLQECVGRVDKHGRLLGYQSRKHGDFYGIKILFVCPGVRRQEHILKLLDPSSILVRDDLVLSSVRTLIHFESVLSESIWSNSQYKKKRLVQ